jgi:hypothetical protein
MATIEVSGGAKLEAKLAELGKLGSAGLKVGFLSGATYPDGTSVAMVAALNNFGAPGAGIPPRPFFSNMVAEKSPGWGEKLTRLLRHTNYDIKAALALMGEAIAGQLRQSIVDTNSPANSMATNLLKYRFPMGDYGFGAVLQAWQDAAAGQTAPAGKPLVWTGQMLASVGSETTDG